MVFFQNPKTLLSSSIATALSEYFVVDVNHIESNLLNDTKIILKDVRLKPQQLSSIPTNTFGKRTNICVTGFVSEVSFTWSWESMTSDSEGWVKDAVLMISGCTFKAQLTEEDIIDDDSKNWNDRDNNNNNNNNNNKHQSSEVTVGKMNAYLTKQIEMVLDALTLTIIDFEMTVEMPSPTVVVMGNTSMSTPTTTTTTTTTTPPGDDSIFQNPQETENNITIVELESRPDNAYSIDNKNNNNNDNNDDGSGSGDNDPNYYTVSFVLGGNEINIVSLGRYNSASDEALKEKISVSSLFINVIETFHETITASSTSSSTTTSNNELSSTTRRRRLVCKTYPLQDPFSYNLEVIRTHGKRFGAIERGLVVKGGHQLQEFDAEDTTSATTAADAHTNTNTTKDEKKKKEGQLSFYLARPQMEGIGQLSGLILAPPEDGEVVEVETASQEIIYKSSSDNINDDDDDRKTLVGDISTFDFSINGASVDFMGDIVAITSINVHYVVDGTDLTVNVDAFRYTELPKENKLHGTTNITFSKIVASMRPSIDVTIGSVSTMFIPGVVVLRTPMENVQAKLIGETWTFLIDSFDGSLPAPPVEVLEDNDSSATQPGSSRNSTTISLRERSSEIGQENEKSTTSSNLMIPFPMSCNINRICLVKDDDKETEITLEGFEILMNPNRANGSSSSNSTDLACSVSRLESKLVRATNINTCMALPAAREEDVDTILNFTLSMDSMSVTAGYSIQDWTNTFQMGGKLAPTKSNTTNSKNNKQSNYTNIPNASVAPLKVSIAYNAMNVVSVKETTFIVKSYKGKESTSVKNLIDFYIAECLNRTPNFISNAELLGINVENAGAFSLGAVFGFASPIGPFVGVAAVVGVDAVRGSIEAGKRSRNAKEGEETNIGDLFRGIGYSAVEATQKGKLRRGCKDDQGSIFDWVVGASVNTGDYIGNNKDTLGSAGGAGAGVLVGTLLGGPIGAVIGGVVGGMTTGTAIRKIDKRIKMGEEEKKRSECTKTKN